jgi:pimeloyl-ACP methyl ester carboxylesterase
MEKLFKINASDAKLIYGYFHQPKLPTNKAVILIHGLTGSMNQYLILTFARHIAEKGIAVFRFDQYSRQEVARKFSESTISTHISDTKFVMQYARSLGYEELTLIGHSLGGPIAIFSADNDTKSLLLWEPTATPSERVKFWQTYDEKHNISYLDWNMKIILEDSYIESAKNCPSAYKHISTLKLPIKIISAELGGTLDFARQYVENAGQKCEFVIVPNAGHDFSEEHAISTLIEESLKSLC